MHGVDDGMGSTEKVGSTGAKFFEALAHPARLTIMRMIVEAGDAGIRSGQVALKSGLPLSSTSQHLGKLAGAGLVRARRLGTAIMYSAAEEAISTLLDEIGGLLRPARGEAGEWWADAAAKRRSRQPDASAFWRSIKLDACALRAAGLAGPNYQSSYGVDALFAKVHPRTAGSARALI